MIMDTRPQWLKWAHQMQSIAQAGLTYGKDLFDLERYKQLQSLAAEIVSTHTTAAAGDVENILASESGYPTPKVDVRAVVFDDLGRLLFVRETSDGGWALPGGWADIGDSAGEVAVREVYEETGYQVVPIKLLGLLDRQKHPHPPMFWHVYKIFVQCKLVGGHSRTSMETDSIDFFARDHIPTLSTARVTGAQISRMFDHYDNPHLQADFD